VWMVSRERLQRLGATVAERATTRRVRVLGQILLAAALVFVILRARSLWHGSHVDWSRVDWAALVGAVVLAAVATFASALIWLAILGSLGVSTHLRTAGIFLQAQLGKYIPGSVWQYAGRAAVARNHGLPVRPVAVSLPIEFAASAVAAGAMGAFLLGWWGALVVGAAAIVLVVVERPARLRAVAVPATVRATFLYLPMWLVLGASFWLCAYGLVGVPVEDLAFYMGAFAIAWVAGLLAIYAPGGLGVREAVLVALLTGRIGAADALVVAAVHRLILVFVDLGLAGIATAAMRRGRPRLDMADTA
jgi:glycosyltransferase 2 family protein